MNNLISTNASMTSKEIAELVGSREDSVKRTIERLAEKKCYIRTTNGGWD